MSSPVGERNVIRYRVPVEHHDCETTNKGDNGHPEKKSVVALDGETQPRQMA